MLCPQNTGSDKNTGSKILRAMTFSLARSIFYSGNFGDTSYYVLEFSQMVSLLARDDVPGSCVFYSHYFLFALE